MASSAAPSKTPLLPFPRPPPPVFPLGSDSPLQGLHPQPPAVPHDGEGAAAEADRLRAEMRRAAAEERFEDAARLRDALARLRPPAPGPPAVPVPPAAAAAAGSPARERLRWDWEAAAAAAAAAVGGAEGADRGAGFEWVRCRRSPAGSGACAGSRG